LEPIQGYIDDAEAGIIFASIIKIQKFNEVLFDHLTERWKDWSPSQKIGDIFKTLAPFLKLYAFYCQFKKPKKIIPNL